MKDTTQTDLDAVHDSRFGGIVARTEPIGLRFAHGVTYRLRSDSLADYLLAPIFLKFMAIAIALIVILQVRPTTANMLGLVSIFQWVTFIGGTLLCLFCFGAICIALKNVGLIKTVYTPFICVPSMLLTEYVTQEALFILWGVPRMTGEETIMNISQMSGVVILLDILYGTFVAPVHPQSVQAPAAQTGRPQSLAWGTKLPVTAMSFDTGVYDRMTLAEVAQNAPPSPEAAIVPTEQADAAAPPRSPPKIRIRENIRPTTLMRPAILIGTERVALDSLVSITAEDHYLRITNLDGKQMIRGKLANVVEQLDPDLGVQVNRSVWVARAQISHAQNEDSRKLTLFMTDGTEVTVARPRLTLVKNCLKRWQIDANGAPAPGGIAMQSADDPMDQAS